MGLPVDGQLQAHSEGQRQPRVLAKFVVEAAVAARLADAQLIVQPDRVDRVGLRDGHVEEAVEAPHVDLVNLDPNLAELDVVNVELERPIEL